MPRKKKDPEEILKLNKLTNEDWKSLEIENIDETGKNVKVRVDSLTPSEFFENVKGLKEEVKEEDLKNVYSFAMKLLRKYKLTGQVNAARKVMFYLHCVACENMLLKKGITKFVYLENILEYIKKVRDRCVVIIELSRYEREIPDEIVDKLEDLDGIFDQYYVVFTDYTGETRKKVNTSRRVADPILFGAFEKNRSTLMSERFYVIGDWVDEKCDLTLDKMMNEYKKIDCVNDPNLTQDIVLPSSYDDLVKRIDSVGFGNEFSHLIISDDEE